MVLVGLNKNIVATELRDRVSLLIDDMKSAIQRVVNDNNEDFNKTADDILENLVGDILDNSLGERLSELFSAYDLVGDTSRDRYILNREIFSFGNDETQIENNPDLTQSLLNLNLYIQTFNIRYAYENSVQISFDNKVDLDTVIDELELEYEMVVESSLIDQDTRNRVIDIRTGSIEFFQTIDLAEITQVKTSLKPSSLISYENYGFTDNADVIVSLNKAYNTAFIEGDIRILSEVQ